MAVNLPIGSLNDNEPPVEDITKDSAEQSKMNVVEDAVDRIRCVRLLLDENIAAYKERQQLIRDTEVVTCTENLAERVALNYIIAKQIISNLPWQDKMLCEYVCSTWHSAVQALRKEQIGPEDFVIKFPSKSSKVGPVFIQSGTFYTEPLVVITFAHTSGLTFISKCENISPIPCKEPCGKEHSLLDFVNYKTNAPKNNLHAIKANCVSYVPLPSSITYEHRVLHIEDKPFIGGLYIPMIPGVEFHTIHINSKTTSMKEEFYDVVGRIAETMIFKGILVYVTERYLLHTMEEIAFLNYFKEIQPEIPYALGGCIIEDTMFNESELNQIVEGANDGIEFISDNLLSIGFFCIPKNCKNMENNFDMFSLVLDASEWLKSKIQQSINEFAKQVPKFEHSVAIKLSCVGRDLKHKLEQDLFRAAFPNTRIVGCYGNGELGLNHPARPTPDRMPNPAKRQRHDSSPQYGILYSYSTVFVYIGWGKKLSSPVRPN